MRFAVLAGLIGMLWSVLPGAALSQTGPGETKPEPDKSGYTRFNPTPTDQMRSSCTDRPTRSILPCTVDAGHFQYEADAFNWAYSHVGGTKTNTSFYTNPTLKLGITNLTDQPALDRLFADPRPGTIPQASFDLAVSWVAWPEVPNLQFDVGTNIGLTRATPRLQAYVGVSQRC